MLLLADGCLACNLSHLARVHTCVAVVHGNVEMRVGLPIPHLPGKGHMQSEVQCVGTYLLICRFTFVSQIIYAYIFPVKKTKIS